MYLSGRLGFVLIIEDCLEGLLQSCECYPFVLAGASADRAFLGDGILAASIHGPTVLGEVRRCSVGSQ